MSTGGIIGLCVGILAFLGIVFGAFGGMYLWRNRDKEYANKVTERAGKNCRFENFCDNFISGNSIRRHSSDVKNL